MPYYLNRYTVVALLIAVVTGCAGLKHDAKIDTSKRGPKDEVAALASARWDALIKGDLAKAYEYLSPGTRSIMSLNLYKARIRPGGWKKATVDSISCEKDLCKVTLNIEYSFKDMKSIDTTLFENWLQESGKWWYVPRK